MQYQAQTVNTAHSYQQDGHKRLNEYVLLEQIARGSFCKVRKVKRHFQAEDGQDMTAEYVMKVFNTTRLSTRRFVYYYGPDECVMTNYLQQVTKEITLHSTLNHPRLVKLYQVIDDPETTKLYMVMEYCDLGQIMDYVGDSEEVKYAMNPKI